MPNIGLFNYAEIDGEEAWIGDFQTIKLSLSGVEFVPNREKNRNDRDDTKPDWLLKWSEGKNRITIGEGWNAMSGQNRKYINAKITDPTVANFSCRLFFNEDGKTAALLA